MAHTLIRIPTVHLETKLSHTSLVSRANTFLSTATHFLASNNKFWASLCALSGFLGFYSFTETIFFETLHLNHKVPIHGLFVWAFVALLVAVYFELKWVRQLKAVKHTYGPLGKSIISCVSIAAVVPNFYYHGKSNYILISFLSFSVVILCFLRLIRPTTDLGLLNIFLDLTVKTSVARFGFGIGMWGVLLLSFVVVLFFNLLQEHDKRGEEKEEKADDKGEGIQAMEVKADDKGEGIQAKEVKADDKEEGQNMEGTNNNTEEVEVQKVVQGKRGEIEECSDE